MRPKTQRLDSQLQRTRLQEINGDFMLGYNQLHLKLSDYEPASVWTLLPLSNLYKYTAKLAFSHNKKNMISFSVHQMNNDKT